MAHAQLNQEIPNEVHPHILVMEDDRNVAKGLKMTLTEAGYGVYVAGTGQSAMSAFKDEHFDLLIADLRLPDTNGMEVIRQVKELDPKTEVIAITGYPTTAIAVEAMKLKVNDFLPKPFTEDQIMKAVNKALNARKERPTVEAAKSDAEKLIQKREVTEVLNRTADDSKFWVSLMENGSEVLKAYTLSSEAKAAILTGDLRWINQNIGELTQKQLMFIYKRLESEAW
jgi:DNA-binding response OmpR family regulator